MGKPGRPSKLTEELQEQVCTLIAEKGLFRSDAAIRCGVAPETFSRWFSKGAVENSEQRYRDFYLAVLDAEARFKETGHEYLKAASSHSPKLMLSVLARRFPHEYGRRDNVEEKSAEDKAAEAQSLRDLLVSRLERLLPAPEAPKTEPTPGVS